MWSIGKIKGVIDGTVYGASYKVVKGMVGRTLNRLVLEKEFSGYLMWNF